MQSAPEVDWAFARRPFWLFSHAFAVSVVALFVVLGLWQLARHNQRVELNEIVGERSTPPVLLIAEALALPEAEIDYRYVEASGSYRIDDFVRVVNRTQSGSAGEHVVAVFRTDDGRDLLVNRGFVPTGTPRPGESAEGAVLLEPAPAGPVTIRGWLRESVEQGWLGASDTGEGVVAPRLDVEAIAGRLDDASATGGTGEAGTVVPVWLLLEDTSDGLATFPDPVPLPPLDNGPHLSYMGQWFIFAVLGVAFYVALLRRNAKGAARSVDMEL